MKSTTEDALRLIRSALRNPDVNLDAEIGVARGWDSLQHLVLMDSVESHFHVKISGAFLGRLTSVKEILNFLREKGCLID